MFVNITNIIKESVKNYKKKSASQNIAEEYFVPERIESDMNKYRQEIIR